MNEQTNPYLEQMQGHDTHEQSQERIKRDRGIIAAGLFVLLAGSLYGNLYQMQQYREVPYIDRVNEHGVVVPIVLPRAAELAEEDPTKQLMVGQYVARWIENARRRPMDANFLASGMSAALNETIGPARLKFKADYNKEDPLKRIKRERIEVVLKATPVMLTTKLWQAEWREILSDSQGNEMKTETFIARITLAEDSKFVNRDNTFGKKVQDYDIQKTTPKLTELSRVQ